MSFENHTLQFHLQVSAVARDVHVAKKMLSKLIKKLSWLFGAVQPQRYPNSLKICFL